MILYSQFYFYCQQEERVGEKGSDATYKKRADGPTSNLHLADVEICYKSYHRNWFQIPENRGGLTTTVVRLL